MLVGGHGIGGVVEEITIGQEKKDKKEGAKADVRHRKERLVEEAAGLVSVTLGGASAPPGSGSAQSKQEPQTQGKPEQETDHGDGVRCQGRYCQCSRGVAPWS